VQDGDEALRPGQIEDAPWLSQSCRYLLAMKRHQIIPAQRCSHPFIIVSVKTVLLAVKDAKCWRDAGKRCSEWERFV
jgi:hypothetical protein